uniref:BLOC-1-related complex subunit 7 n=1 Tax=Phlebotomus kandelakii TaxID=1109342 RepID=A0A6B2E6K6_9DIPT
MASASSSSAKNLFSDSKRRLADRVMVNVHNSASVARQIVRGSKSNEILMQSARNFAQAESSMENSAQNLKKMQLIRQHMGYQVEAMSDGVEKLEYIKEQVCSMER